MESMDKYLCELFYNVMDKHLIDFLCKQKVRYIKRALPEIRRKYKGDKAKESLVHSFPVPKKIPYGQETAYFYECSTCLASSTAKTFQDLITNNREAIKKITSRKTINISCIAAGIASELVAVIKILSYQSSNFIHFSLKFININDTWNDITSAVLNELLSYGNENAKVKISWEFELVRDKKEHCSQDILEIFQSTDILLTTKFSHDLSDMKDKQLQQLLQVAFTQMKPNSLFFFIDASTADFIKHLEKDLSSRCSFQNIYKKINDYHTLTIDSIQEHLERYREHFGVDLNSSYCLLSVSAWLKLDRRRNSKQEFGSTPALNIKPYQVRKEKKEARKDFFGFRRAVESLFGQRKR